MTTIMEENKIIKNDLNIDSIKHYCRVCTFNTRSKKPRSEDQSIGIFKKIGLKSVLEKFLHLELSEDDPLPKSICKKCFDKIMAIEFLQVVAKRSEKLFKDFLTNRSPEQVVTIQDNYKTGNFVIPPPRKLENQPEEVVVNVSMSDPLTKDIKKKLQVAQSKRDSIGMAFTPDHINRNAVTSSPITQVPVTIVHRMPKKRKAIPNPLEGNQIVQIPTPAPPPPYSNTTTVTLENPPKKKMLPIEPKINPTSPLRHISEAPVIPQNVEIHPVVTGNPQAMGHGMPLGSIIKDVDLLKLILKALKWPYNSQTLDIQIQRLKDTNFNDIIVDPNLLQDTDLIQILGPLLAPLPVTMQQQTYHITIPPETLDVPPTTMSYKLPAETSVQIITVPAAEKEDPNKLQRKKSHIKSYVNRKKFHSRPGYTPPVIVVSDESDDDQSLKTISANEEIPNFGVQLDPAVYPGVGENSNSNEAMLAKLNRQREAMMRMHRSKRKQSLNCAKNVEMVDDIMIVDEGFHVNEPYHNVVLTQKTRETHDSRPGTSSKSGVNKGLTLESVKKDHASSTVHARIKNPPAAHSNPSTSMKVVQRSSSDYISPEKAQPVRGFVKLKEGSTLPPLKKVKVVSRTPSYVQVKEPSKLAYTTVADADSTTKIVIKDSKAPKPAKYWKFGSRISKDKNGAQIQTSESAESGEQSAEIAKKEEDKEKKNEDDVVVYVEEESAKEKKEESLPEKKKSPKKTPIVTRPKSLKKNEYKILGTYYISDDEMEQLHVDEEPSKEMEPSIDEEQQTATAVDEPLEESSLKATTSVVEDSSIETKNDESKPSEVESPEKEEEEKEASSIELPAIEIKSEDNEIDIKKEELESDEVKTNESAGTPKKPQRNFVASKTTIKTEIIKSTRSSTKRKVIPKEEEAPKETTGTFRPARKSKTLSKYYKGPPLSGTAGRSMRSRT
ncbi:uncharacterized protein LOC129905599 isoform X2 [Episyrphus balteatus]|uniref:uncharacterized protein LOC129905599 isoform X2 n=1 Tax=Episyrphus balteatus TaxID=286459 RepID=UPI0024864D02|nr:uncharacterized protein LOC129905599 isoform X2 [Episyrphus balteatus]